MRTEGGRQCELGELGTETASPRIAFAITNEAMFPYGDGGYVNITTVVIALAAVAKDLEARSTGKHSRGQSRESRELVALVG
jgi:hypothetical protein